MGLTSMALAAALMDRVSAVILERNAAARSNSPVAGTTTVTERVPATANSVAAATAALGQALGAAAAAIVTWAATFPAPPSQNRTP